MRIVNRRSFTSTLPDGDTHPYRTGPWRPQHTEYDATDLKVIGTLPDDLNGVYLRNTENPLHEALGRYHPFDGDGMVHAVHFHDGRADYRNRFVRTKGSTPSSRRAGRCGRASPRTRRERCGRRPGRGHGRGPRTRPAPTSPCTAVVR